MKTFFSRSDEHNSAALLCFPNWGVNPSCKPLHILFFNPSMWTKLACREGENQLCPSFRFSRQNKIQSSRLQPLGTPSCLDDLTNESCFLLQMNQHSLCDRFGLLFALLWQEVYLEADHEGAATGVLCSHYYLVKKGDRSGLMVQCGRGVPIWTSHLSLETRFGPYPKVQATKDTLVDVLPIGQG